MSFLHSLIVPGIAMILAMASPGAPRALSGEESAPPARMSEAWRFEEDDDGEDALAAGIEDGETPAEEGIRLRA